MKPTFLVHAIIMIFFLYFCYLNVDKGMAETKKGFGLKKIVKGSNAFAIDLYGQLARTSKNNTFFSPGSIHAALAMTYLGARNETAREMADVLHLALDPDQVAPAFGELIKALNSPLMILTEEHVDGQYKEKEVPAYRLAIANALWAMKDYPFKETYTEAVREHFDAELKALDFVHDPEPSRRTINEWVENKTNQKIKELIPMGMIRSDTRLVLTNAIYFMSNWAEAFEKGNTKDLPFTRVNGTEVTCPQMFQQDRFGYMETDDFQGLSLPYKGYDLEMVIFLPKKKDGLPGLEKQLTVEKLNKWMSRFESHEVKVTLPKFKFDYATSLVDTLKAMGMNMAFTWPGADFSGMTGSKELVISAVLHKAFVAVDEEGTEAAAATAVLAVLGEAPQPKKVKPKIFKADHPFLFMIRHQKTGAVLFMGRLTEPEKK